MKPQESETLEPRIRILQIICLAMIMGVIVFLLLMLVLKIGEINSGLSLLTLLGIGFAIPAFLASIIVPKIVAGSGIKNAANKLDEAGQKAESEDGLKSVFEVFQAANIIRFALLEGAMFFNAMLFFLRGSVASLIVVGVGLAIMIMFFPRRDAATAWVEERVADVSRKHV